MTMFDNKKSSFSHARNWSSPFYVEALLLVLIMLFATVVIFSFLSSARTESLLARQTSDAVLLAQNTAEIFSGTQSDEEFLEEIVQMPMVLGVYEGSGDNAVRLDCGEFVLKVTLSEETTSTGVMRHAAISVISDGDEIYALDTDKYSSGRGGE